jgi:hypothetical protein
MRRWAIQVILPVWGYSLRPQFLECGLPTLLAPGNVPGVAARIADGICAADKRR